MTRADILVVGGGIIGASIADALLEEGHHVLLLERGAIGREASWAAGGILNPIEPWNYAPPMLSLCQASLGIYPDFVARLEAQSGMGVEIRRTGMIELFFTPEEEADALARLPWREAHGFPVERIDAVRIHELEPAASKRAISGLYDPEMMQVRNPRLLKALARAIVARGGRIRTGVTVERLLVEGERILGVETTTERILGERVILAGGAWTSRLLSTSLPPEGGGPTILPCRGQILLATPQEVTLRQILFHRSRYLIPRADGRLLIGSTVEFVGFDERVTVAATGELSRAAVTIAPALAGAPVEKTWAGLRPYTEDLLPVIGAFEEPRGLYIATGHYRNGILLAPITAALITDLIAGRPPRHDVMPFSPHRSASASMEEPPEEG